MEIFDRAIKKQDGPFHTLRWRNKVRKQCPPKIKVDEAEVVKEEEGPQEEDVKDEVKEAQEEVKDAQEEAKEDA